MIHSVYLPSATATTLNKLVEILIATCNILRDTARSGPLTPDQIKAAYAAVDDTGNEEKLAAWFATQDLPNVAIPELADWLDKAIVDMTTVKTLPRSAPRLAGDISALFDDAVRKEKAKILPDNGKWPFLVRTFFEDLYRKVRDGGIPAELRPSTGTLNGQTLLQNFSSDKRNPRICPVCDMELAYQVWPSGMTRSPYRAQLDHYFPKSHYPHLALHPHNLVPICRSCNEGRNDSLYPLGPAWEDAWLPYQDPGLAQSHYFAEPNTLEALPGAQDVKQTALTSLSSDYKIPGRWEHVRDQAEQEVFARLRAYAAVNGLEDMTALEGVLQIVLRETIGREFGKLPFAFLRAGVIRRMLLTETSRGNALLPAGSRSLLDNLRTTPADDPGTEHLMERYLS